MEIVLSSLSVLGDHCGKVKRQLINNKEDSSGEASNSGQRFFRALHSVNSNFAIFQCVLLALSEILGMHWILDKYLHSSCPPHYRSETPTLPFSCFIM